MAAPLKIAIAGLGTVGAGVVKLLAENGELLAQRCGRPVVVTAVSARDKARDRGVDLGQAEWFDDAAALAAEADADIVIELIGGSDGIARRVCETSIARGRSVITANKALLAVHGTALARAAEEKGVALCYEAAVAGGIPVIKALREGLAANRILRVYGILNGTCNYILTQMRRTGRPFAEVLAEAQGSAMPRPIRASMWTASMPRTSSRSWPASPSVRRSISPASISRASATSPRSIWSSPRSWATASSCSGSRA